MCRYRKMKCTQEKSGPKTRITVGTARGLRCQIKIPEVWGRGKGYVTVTICPLPSLRITTSQSKVSLVSKHWTSVGSNGFILTYNEPLSTADNKVSLSQTCRFSMKDRPRTTSKWGSSERKTAWEVETVDSSRSPWSLRTYNLIGQDPML